MKGKPWTFEEENKLHEIVKSGVDLDKTAVILGKSPDAVRQKLSVLD